MSMKVKELIELTAKATANHMVEKLKKENRIKSYNLNSFKRTEELLCLYPKLKAESPEKQMIDKALKTIENDEYFGIIESRYFEGMTFEELAEIYNAKRQTISYQRCKLIKALAKELFPEEVAKEIMEN